MSDTAPRARFRAPWGGLLIATSVTLAAVLIGASLLMLSVLPRRASGLRLLAALLPPAVVFLSLGFTVRGYVLTHTELIIERFGWRNRFPLATLGEVTVDPQAMEKTLRLLGNGGLFVFCGWYRNRKLGLYRAFITDPRRCVVLKFAGRAVVVTPESPEAFAREAQSRRQHL
jgi:hypothetical protein